MTSLTSKGYTVSFEKYLKLFESGPSAVPPSNFSLQMICISDCKSVVNGGTANAKNPREVVLSAAIAHKGYLPEDPTTHGWTAQHSLTPLAKHLKTPCVMQPLGAQIFVA